MSRGGLLLVLGWALVFGLARSKELNRFIRHYEPVDYDHHTLMWNHHRLKRSLMGPPHVEFGFTAFNRDFYLVLEPERRLFHPNFVMKRNGVPVKGHQAKTFVYSGYDLFDQSCRVHGSLAHGVFDGTIRCKDQTYHLEPSMRYTAHLNDTDTFHSVIYKQSDLDHSTLSGATCGSTHGEINKTMLRVQTASYEQTPEEDHMLKKRQSSRNSNKVRCWLNVVLDYKLFRELTDNNEDPLAVLFGIILTGSSIFEDTDFNGDGVSDGIHFGVLQFEIQDEPPAAGDFFANEFIGVSAFLSEHSAADYSDFCLSYRFTYRDFDMGVVGLAYIAPQPGQNIAGGVCQMASGLPDNPRTLNTGIVTSLNFGNRIPPSLSALTFAHEAGHNFGSQHDVGDPPEGGAYIMHAFATDGSEPNNDRFSQASINMMDAVIATRGQGASGCFVEADDLCGNNLLDPGEECDCGPSSRQFENGVCRDNPCCVGSNCTLSLNVDCSPDQGPCCNADCTFIDAVDGVICSGNTDCAFNQTCGGTSAKCPEPMAREVPDPPGYLLCNNDQGLCDGPTCNGTICIALGMGMEPCECTSMEQACHVCCMIEGECTSTIDIANSESDLRDDLPNGMGQNLTVGSPCANFTGYCDLLNNCLAVDEDGALFRLANLFFNSEALRRFIEFTQERWWVLVIGGVVLLAGMFLLVMCCHCLLPRPKTAQSRQQRRSARKQGRPHGSHPKPVQEFPAGDYPQNYPQYYGH